MWFRRTFLAAALVAAAAGAQHAGSNGATLSSPDTLGTQPRHVAYRALERALLTYRQLAADSTLRPPLRTTTPIRPGDVHPDLRALTRFLVALGDLKADDVDTATTTGHGAAPVRYEGALVEAVSRFQRRHGLAADGVIGRATKHELQVPLARRVWQIEVALERWHQLPPLPSGEHLIVNIPAFELGAFANDSTADQPSLTMRVIVGIADRRHATPAFAATMREVVFHPYWDVPARIARTELVPLFRRSPTAFDRGGYEIVSFAAAGAEVISLPPSAENLSRVAAGTLRLRQKPGPENALGTLKFVLPNPYQVFLHDTPTRGLFARVRRDFSHGCVRVGDPAALAEFVLRGQSPWTRAAIDSMVSGTNTTRVPLARPLPIYVIYATAAASPDGTVWFYPDVYTRDAAFARSLAADSTRP